MRRLLIALIRLYQRTLSPDHAWWVYRFNRPPHCRFHPTCSQYAIEAIERHGSIRWVQLAFARILRCHPYSRGGHDPVPECPKHLDS